MAWIVMSRQIYTIWSRRWMKNRWAYTSLLATTEIFSPPAFETKRKPNKKKVTKRKFLFGGRQKQNESMWEGELFLRILQVHVIFHYIYTWKKSSTTSKRSSRKVEMKKKNLAIIISKVHFIICARNTNCQCCYNNCLCTRRAHIVHPSY